MSHPPYHMPPGQGGPPRTNPVLWILVCVAVTPFVCCGGCALVGLFGAGAGTNFVGSSNSGGDVSKLLPPLLPEVKAFLDAHSEYGPPLSTEAVPDWASGKRQRVVFESGRSFLFYTKSGKVVSVYEDENGRRQKIWDSAKGSIAKEPGFIVSMRGTLKEGWSKLPSTVSAEEILVYAAQAPASAELIAEAKSTTLTSEQRKLVGQYYDSLSSYQRKLFPKMRSIYGKVMREKLWEEDIEVRTFGTSSRNIEFCGGLFAANKNIKTFQEAAGETLRGLRFSRVQYPWYRGSEYTYYDLKPPRDGDVCKLNGERVTRP